MSDLELEYKWYKAERVRHIGTLIRMHQEMEEDIEDIRELYAHYKPVNVPSHKPVDKEIIKPRVFPTQEKIAECKQKFAQLRQLL